MFYDIEDELRQRHRDVRDVAAPHLIGSVDPLDKQDARGVTAFKDLTFLVVA